MYDVPVVLSITCINSNVKLISSWEKNINVSISGPWRHVALALCAHAQQPWRHERRDGRPSLVQTTAGHRGSWCVYWCETSRYSQTDDNAVC